MEPDAAAIYANNRRHWDELTAVHLAPGGYDLAPLRRGEGRLARAWRRPSSARPSGRWPGSG